MTEVAAALFEAGADHELDVPLPSTDTLYGAFRASVGELGPVGVAEVVDTFNGLDAAEFFEVGVCRTFAYRLALSFWYAGARSRPMTAAEAAVALYLSDAYRHHQVDALTFRRAPLLVSRAIRQGAALVPVETLMRLGEAMVRELASPAPVTAVTPGGTQVRPGDGSASQEGVTAVTPGRDWLYRQALPDYHRRRFCFDLMRADTHQPSPLLVRLDGGGYLLGATPPAGPDGTWTRTLRAQW
ncbi:hypothetical protein ACIQPP_01905 [Streptomyces violaceusniger]|uniref:hypothetical protein n=1 Tax=Streptomyces violaceusniger TaxID=68280 RepID=UPI0009C3E06B|nr:hypothetical protein [Streptomyces hygroscopicus]AQW53410.1 hypothetical protein SHXM_06873 [Streptomyces hygroscopicus]